MFFFSFCSIGHFPYSVKIPVCSLQIQSGTILCKIFLKLDSELFTLSTQNAQVWRDYSGDLSLLVFRSSSSFLCTAKSSTARRFLSSTTHGLDRLPVIPKAFSIFRIDSAGNPMNLIRIAKHFIQTFCSLRSLMRPWLTFLQLHCYTSLVLQRHL